MDELKVVLLKNWKAKGFSYPVYGIVDAEELNAETGATLVVDGGYWCQVIATDVVIVQCIDIGDLIGVNEFCTASLPS